MPQFYTLSTPKYTGAGFTKWTSRYDKALDLHEAVGSKKGIADQHGNLGNVALARRDLDQAEARYDKALKLHEAVGSKLGMANAYGSLASIYQMRGNLDQAQVTYHKALTLFQEIGATPQADQVQALLHALRVQHSP
jgi:tetratricopeptide (TPR) repeat protein